MRHFRVRIFIGRFSTGPKSSTASSTATSLGSIYLIMRGTFCLLVRRYFNYLISKWGVVLSRWSTTAAPSSSMSNTSASIRIMCRICWSRQFTTLLKNRLWLVFSIRRLLFLPSIDCIPCLVSCRSCKGISTFWGKIKQMDAMFVWFSMFLRLTSLTFSMLSIHLWCETPPSPPSQA